MTTADEQGTDPFDNPFDGDYQPDVAFAIVASQQAQERLGVAEDLVQQNLAQNADATNLLARSARKSCQTLLDRLRGETVACGAAAAMAVATTAASTEHGAAVHEAIAAFKRAALTYDEIPRPAAVALTPDEPPVQHVDPPLPKVHSWADVVQKVNVSTLGWGSRVRGMNEQVLILKPSPSTGKTTSMIDLALQEQAADQRVVFTARTKDVLLDELKPRIEKQNRFVKLHVILGRDKDTCMNIDNVEAVQAHGYAPARSVCLGCDRHPRNAPQAGLSICPYYQSRMRAQNDSMATQNHPGLFSPPLILTTHSGLLSAQNSGGGLYGKFWPADLILLDEDPTEAFEPVATLTDRHASFSSLNDHEASALAAVLRGAIEMAELERAQMEQRRWRDVRGQPSPIHHKSGSSYAGNALHSLLERVSTGTTGQKYGVRSATQVMRDAADNRSEPETSGLYGLTTPEAINQLIPPRSLADFGEAMHAEFVLAKKAKLALYTEVRGHAPPMISGVSSQQAGAEASKEIDGSAEDFDTSYRCRLEFSKKEGTWQFVIQNFINLVDHKANIVIGDAYAHVDHYRGLLNKPKPRAGHVDPVTVVDHTARFPEGSRIVVVKAEAGITYLVDRGGWQPHAAMLAGIFTSLAGKTVLVYGSKELKGAIKELFDDNNDFGIAEWSWEHWWSGRGKDQYRHYDAVVCINPPIQSPAGSLHKANARALRDFERSHALEDAQRIPDPWVLDKWDRMKTTPANTIRRAHRRLQDEHERQNINELAQAMHRNRPLISAKVVIAVGDSVELTVDTIAASIVTVADDGTPDPTSGTGNALVTANELAVLGTHELKVLINAVQEMYGVWMPAFLHTVWAYEMGLLVESASGVPCNRPNCVDCYTENNVAEYEPSDRSLILSDSARRLIAVSPSLPGAAGCCRSSLPMTLMERIWTPPPGWEDLSRRVQTKGAYKTIRADVQNGFKNCGDYRPTWWPKSDRSHGFAWYSNLATDKAMKIVAEIMNDQYGPTVDGKVFAPRRKPFVPF